MIKKKEQYEIEKKQKMEEAKQKRKEFYELCQQNKRDLIQDQCDRREEILEDQNVFFNRGLNKDNVTNLKRINANERTVIAQLTLEKNLYIFNKKMNQIKNSSILKKSPQQRLAMYKEKKRQEEEKRKKELEEKMDKEIGMWMQEQMSANSKQEQVAFSLSAARTRKTLSDSWMWKMQEQKHMKRVIMKDAHTGRSIRRPNRRSAQMMLSMQIRFPYRSAANGRHFPTPVRQNM